MRSAGMEGTKVRIEVTAPSTTWHLRMAVDASFRAYALLRVRRGGRWNRIAMWKADMLKRAGLAQWIN